MEKNGKFHQRKIIQLTFSSSGITSNPEDLTQFIQSLFHEELIKKSSLEIMKNQRKLWNSTRSISSGKDDFTDTTVLQR